MVIRWYKDRGLRWNIVQFIINNNLFNKVGKFKVGDKVRYNWFAKIQLSRGYSSGHLNGLYTIKALIIKGENCEFVEGSGCSVFWLRKATRREIDRLQATEGKQEGGGQ